MLEILQFIFSDGWHWVGGFFMLSLVVAGIASMFRGVVSIHHHRHLPASKKDTEIS